MQTGLISQALVIGSVEAAVYWTDEGLCALRQESSGGYVDCSRQASLLLDCPAEKRLVVDVSREQLEASITLWSRCQRLLIWLITGMDGTLSDETRRLSLGLAETAWTEEIATFARARLLGCPLPSDADPAGAIRLANGLPHCLGMFQDLMAAVEYIEPVSRKLKELVYFDYAGDVPPDETYRALLDQGIVAAAVTLLAQGDGPGLDKLVKQFSGNHELLVVCPRLVDLLTFFVGWITNKYAHGNKIARFEANEVSDDDHETNRLTATLETAGSDIFYELISKVNNASVTVLPPLEAFASRPLWSRWLLFQEKTGGSERLDFRQEAETSFKQLVKAGRVGKADNKSVADVDYITNSLLSDYSTIQQLEKAVKNGSRAVVKGFVKSLINKNIPELSSVRVIDLVTDFIFDYFG